MATRPGEIHLTSQALLFTTQGGSASYRCSLISRVPLHPQFQVAETLIQLGPEVHIFRSSQCDYAAHCPRTTIWKSLLYKKPSRDLGLRFQTQVLSNKIYHVYFHFYGLGIKLACTLPTWFLIHILQSAVILLCFMHPRSVSYRPIAESRSKPIGQVSRTANNMSYIFILNGFLNNFARNSSQDEHLPRTP